MIKKVDHVAIAVKDLDASIAAYEKLLGIKPAKVEVVADQGVKAALFMPKGGGEIELIQPIDPKSGVAKFLETRGEGLHHMCLEVDNVDAELKAMADKGVATIDKVGRKGLAGRVGFLHPKSTGGVLIELAQKEH